MRPHAYLRRFAIPLCLGMAALMFTSPAQAEVLGKSWDFSVNFGGMFVSRDFGDDNLAGALRAGYSFTPWIELEGSWTIMRTESVNDDAFDADMDLYGFDVLYHFLPDGDAVPYVFLGAGLMVQDVGILQNERVKNTDFFWEGGGGVKIPVSEHLDVRFDIRFQKYRSERLVQALCIPSSLLPTPAERALMLAIRRHGAEHREDPALLFDGTLPRQHSAPRIPAPVALDVEFVAQLLDLPLRVERPLEAERHLARRAGVVGEADLPLRFQFADVFHEHGGSNDRVTQRDLRSSFRSRLVILRVLSFSVASHSSRL